MHGFLLQIVLGTFVTLALAGSALIFGLIFGLLGALLESIPNVILRYVAAGFIFIIRGLPELLVLFFIYFGMTACLSDLFHHYINISPFVAGVVALGLIFGAYASQVFRGAFLAVETGQIEAGVSVGFSKRQIFFHIKLPQAWRHALPGLGNLWLVLLKDTAIVTLIGLSDMMNATKMAVSTTHVPFTYYFIASLIYLIITSFSQQFIQYLNLHANRYISS